LKGKELVSRHFMITDLHSAIPGCIWTKPCNVTNRCESDMITINYRVMIFKSKKMSCMRVEACVIVVCFTQ
jgi:hypothetical protein